MFCVYISGMLCLLIQNMIYLFMKLSEPEAAITPQNLDFDASALDPMKHAETKGSNHSSDSRICCLCPPERAEAKKRTKS